MAAWIIGVLLIASLWVLGFWPTLIILGILITMFVIYAVASATTDNTDSDELEKELKRQRKELDELQALSDKLSRKLDTEDIVRPICAHISFSYVDFEGRSSHRNVDVYAYDDGYLEGYCHTRHETRTFKTSRISGDITDMTTGEIFTPRKWMAKMRNSRANLGVVQGRNYRPN